MPSTFDVECHPSNSSTIVKPPSKHFKKMFPTSNSSFYLTNCDTIPSNVDDDASLSADIVFAVQRPSRHLVGCFQNQSAFFTAISDSAKCFTILSWTRTSSLKLYLDNSGLIS